MKFAFWFKLTVVCLALLTLGGLLAPKAEAELAYTVLYLVGGSVSDPDGVGTEGRWVVFYKDNPDTGYADDYVGVAGLAGQLNRYIINAYEDQRMPVAPGKYFIAIVTDSTDGYGANPIEINISGNGYDFAATDLVLAKGAGIAAPKARPVLGTEPAPDIKIWFGNRLFQPAIYGRKEDGKKPFVVPEKGRIKIEVTVPDPFLLNESSSYTLRMQTPQGEGKIFDLSSMAGLKASAAGVKPLVIETAYPEDLRAEADESVYVFSFSAGTRGTFGTATSVTTQAAVTVMGGPVKLIGTPITFPSPAHLKTDREAFFQYTLSRGANIDLYMFDVSGRVVKKLSFNEGDEGGSAGVNKIRWDLITDQGSIVASGIYVFNLVDRSANKSLGRGKFTALP